MLLLLEVSVGRDVMAVLPDRCPSASDANPIITESVAKQLLRSKRQDRPRKAGHPDEPMRVRQLDLNLLHSRHKFSHTLV